MRRKGYLKMKNIDNLTAARLGAGGFAAGVVSGIFGNGGGVLTVFLLGALWQKLFKDKREIYSNAPISMLPIALTSALVYSSGASPDKASLIAVAAASLLGGGAGALAMGKMKLKVLSKIFAGIMIVSGVIMLLS